MSARMTPVSFLKLMGAGSIAVVLCIAACSDDDGSSSTATTTNSSSASAGGAGGGSCMPGELGGQAGSAAICAGEASDTACVTCTRMKCCDQLQACLPDTNCHCLLECFLGGCDPVGCLADCGGGNQTDALISCVSNMQTGCPVCLQ